MTRLEILKKLLVAVVAVVEGGLWWWPPKKDGGDRWERERRELIDLTNYLEDQLTQLGGQSPDPRRLVRAITFVEDMELLKEGPARVVMHILDRDGQMYVLAPIGAAVMVDLPLPDEKDLMLDLVHNTRGAPVYLETEKNQ